MYALNDVRVRAFIGGMFLSGIKPVNFQVLVLLVSPLSAIVGMQRIKAGAPAT